MLTRRAPIAALVGLLVIVGMSGCFGGSKGAQPTPSAKSSASPLFASDEEALAAATKAYAAFQETSDQILRDGGANPERINKVAASDVASTEMDGYSKIARDEWRLVGGTTFDSVTLESRTPIKGGGEAVAIYLCADASAVDVVDSAGKSVVSPTRPDRTPFEVTLAGTPASSLIVSARSVWPGEDFCTN